MLTFFTGRTALLVLAGLFVSSVAAEPTPGASSAVVKPPSKTQTPEPLANVPSVGADDSGVDPTRSMADMLPPRTDSPHDWYAGLEPLHQCGEPRWLPPCIPPPPCHPSCPPQPFDLIGVDGMPTRGPRYRGPCCPRTGTYDDHPFPCMHRLHDRAFDWFYRPK